MEVAPSSIRLVGAPRKINGRKMSGLGIVFSEASTPDSASYHWEDDLPDHPSFSYEGPVPRTSRWSESTQQSKATKSDTSNNASARISQGNSVASRSSTQPSAPESAYVSNIVVQKRPSVIEVQAFIAGRHDQRSARGSDDSQSSYGPVTPNDEGCDRQLRLGAFESFGETPRKAPAPPTICSEVSADPTSKLHRRPSLTQSMMRTLNGRKKETRPPPPLNIVPPVPLITALPPNYDVPTIVHHLERPLPKRSGTSVSDCTNAQKSPALVTVSQRPSTSSGRRSSGSSFNTLFRTMRKSISRKSSKASPLIEACGKMSISKSPVPSLKSNAPSFVNIQVETYTQVQSTPSSPDTSRRAALRHTRPAGHGGKAGSRPSTAPAGQRGDFSLAQKALIPAYTGIHSKVSSPATTSLATMGEDVSPSTFDIQYRNPWRKTAGFEPAPGYSQSSIPPPSPPSWLVSHQAATRHKSACNRNDNVPKRDAEVLAAPKKSLAIPGASSANSLSSSSPTSVPSWTPMVALPSPNVSILQTPSRNFLELEPSPSSGSYAFDLPAANKFQSCSAESKSAFLSTPGQVSMRDPWTKPKDATDSEGHIQAMGGQALTREDSDASRYSDSSARSLGLSPSTQLRRLSRKSVPKIDENELLSSPSSPSNGRDRSNSIYTGCRPFRRPSVDEQLSDMVTFKNPFLARASFANTRDSQGQADEYVSDMFRSKNLARRNFSTSTTDSMKHPPPHLPRPSFPTFETTYSIRRPSYASEMSNQSFPSKPTRFEFSRRPTLPQSEGIRVSFDAGIML